MEKVGKLFRFLLAMCPKNNLEEHLFTFLKSIWENHHLLDDSDQGSLKEISVNFFLSQILPIEGSINRKIKYENFKVDVSLISILNLIC